MIRWLLVGLFLIGSFLIAPAALAAQQPYTTATRLQLHPAAAPSPSLKHLLLPELRDLQPGNAAVFYQRTHSPVWTRQLYQQPWAEKLGEWLEKPYGLWPKAELEAALAFQDIFKELDHAARCEGCDWQMSPRLREAGFSLMLPDVQGFRVFAQMLAVKARHEIHQGKFDDAVRTLQTGLAMSRHLNDGPIVVNSLVSMAIAHMMCSALEDFVQQPGAPNLYWALRDLPTPFLDLRRPMQGDRLAVDAVFPELRQMMSEPKFTPLPLATIRARLGQVRFFGSDDRSSFATHAALTQPKAKAHFRALGHRDDELDALPVTQLAIMYALAHWDRSFDAVYRWHNVPYWQARAGIKKAVEERNQDMRLHREAMLLVQHFLPGHESVLLQKARLERRLAALQCVEALRLHAAAHDGVLPDALDELRAVPLPLDPVTGRTFDYKIEDRVARLYGAPPPGEAETERNVVYYQITVNRTKSR